MDKVLVGIKPTTQEEFEENLLSLTNGEISKRETFEMNEEGKNIPLTLYYLEQGSVETAKEDTSTWPLHIGTWLLGSNSIHPMLLAMG